LVHLIDTAEWVLLLPDDEDSQLLFNHNKTMVDIKMCVAVRVIVRLSHKRLDFKVVTYWRFLPVELG
jgi:hypothetical protein